MCNFKHELISWVRDADEEDEKLQFYNNTPDFLDSVEAPVIPPDILNTKYRVSLLLGINILCVLIALNLKLNHFLIKVNNFISSYVFYIILGMWFGLLEFSLRELDLMPDFNNPELQIHISGYLLGSLRVPVLLHASYNLYHHHFFSQIVYILLYSVLMRIIFLALASSIDMAIWNLLRTTSWDEDVMNYSNMIAFTSVAAVVNPLTVYNMFKDKTPKNFYLMLGIHILGNGITLEVYKASFRLAHLSKSTDVPALSYVYLTIKCLINFNVGILIGCIVGIITSLYTKWSRREPSCEFYEPTITIVGMMITYFICEYFDLSSVFGVFCCGIVQERYVFMNMASRSVMSVKNACEAMSFQADVTGYVLVGYKFFGYIFIEDKNRWNWIEFAAISLVIHYAIKIFLTAFLSLMINIWKNSWGKNPISTRLQALLVFGGVKGAKSFALIASYRNAPFGEMFIRAINFMIVFSVLVDFLISKFIARSLRKRLEAREDVNHIPVFPDVMETKVDWFTSLLIDLETKFYSCLVIDDYFHKDEVREKREHDREEANKLIDEIPDSNSKLENKEN